MSRDWIQFYEDLLEFCSRIEEYTLGLSRAEFESRKIVYDATLRNVELIGEAAKRIPETVRQRIPEVPWQRLVATRNILAHGYFGIDNDILWDIVENKIPELREKLALAHEAHPALFEETAD